MDIELIKGFDLGNQLKIVKKIDGGDEWQIYVTNQTSRVLLATKKIVAKWVALGILVEGVFQQIQVGGESFYLLISPANSLVESVAGAFAPGNKVDALAFAVAMRETRHITVDASFHDAIFVERYSRLLPIWKEASNVPDEIVLGTWLTGGVNISVNSFKRLRSILSWLSLDDLVDIIKEAGLSGVDRGGDCKGSCQNVGELGEAFSLPGRNALEKFLNDYVVDIVKEPDKYKMLGVDFPGAILLHGPSGSGKTYAVQRLVEYLAWPSFNIDSGNIGSSYIHETSKKIAEVFDQAINSAPSIVIIDEMESFLSGRQGSGHSLHHTEEVGEFLRKIPQARENNVLIIAMTNMLDCIDSAILRKGRFDHVIEVGMPSYEEVYSLLVSLLGTIRTDENIKIEDVADQLAGRAMSDVTYVVREAGRIAAKRGKTKIDQECLEAVMLSLTKAKDVSRRIGFVTDIQGG